MSNDLTQYPPGSYDWQSIVGGDKDMSEGTQVPQKEIPRMQSRLSACINVLREEINLLEEELDGFLGELESDKGPVKEPIAAKCDEASRLSDLTVQVDETIRKLKSIFERIQI